MKSVTLNLSKAVLMLFIATLTLASCSKDKIANKELEGDWEVKSFTLDGVEQMDVLFTSFEMQFKGDSDIGGEAEWDFIAVDGSSTKVEADYEISDDGTEIDLEGDDFNMTIDGDDLELSGNLGGNRWDIEAKRD